MLKEQKARVEAAAEDARQKEEAAIAREQTQCRATIERQIQDADKLLEDIHQQEANIPGYRDWVNRQRDELVRKSAFGGIGHNKIEAARYREVAEHDAILAHLPRRAELIAERRLAYEARLAELQAQLEGFTA